MKGRSRVRQGGVRSGWFVALLVWLGLGCQLLVPALAQADVLALRLADRGETTRFVIETRTQPSYEIFTLAQPARLVVDLTAQRFNLEQTPGSAGLVRSVRYGQFSETRSRVVLDMRSGVELASLNLIPPQDGFGYRLVLDLRAVPEAIFSASTLAQSEGEWQSEPAWSSGAEPSQAEPASAGTPGVQPAQVVGGILIPARRPATAAALGRPTIVIDAGHGGRDSGAISPGGLQEKTVTLQIARRFARALAATGYYEPVLTRDSDIFITLDGRVRLAQEAHGDLFVSLHADSNRVSSLQGMSIYTISEQASDALAASLAESENASDELAGIEVSNRPDEVTFILYDLIHRDTVNQALAFSDALVAAARTEGVALINRPQRSAGFRVLKSPDVPSVLVEVGFLTNVTDERRLTHADYQDQLVATLVRALDTHFGF